MAYKTYGRDTLIDPAPGGLGTYAFDINHLEEDEYGNERQLTVTRNTSDGIAMTQQGDSAVQTKVLKGTILKESQHAALAAFAKKSGRLDPTNTLIYRDFYGEEFEVLIQSYKVTPVRLSQNRRDPTMRRHKITYTLVLLIINVRNGAFA